MLDRRTLFKGTAATTAAAGVGLSVNETAAAEGTPSWNVAPRGMDGRLVRLPSVDLESRQDFLTGHRIFVNGDYRTAMTKRAMEVLATNKIDPQADVPLEQAVKLFSADPIIAGQLRSWLSSQRLMWSTIRDYYHANADMYLSEMQKAERAGPGSLELDDNMDIPLYATHEIHIQPGGYTGDPFAGHLYHYGTNNFYMHRNQQDELHLGYAAAVPLPEDRKVRRILDVGCSCGQLATALKQRFPEAEIWGIDVGAPMVRYSHMRAAKLGIDVNFAQRLGEDTKFPDNHFDIVTSYLLHHEMTADASRAMFKELRRILRPGGLYFPMDLASRRPLPKPTALQKWNLWWNQRWNDEVWFYDYHGMDFDGDLKRAGLEVRQAGATGMGGGGGANVLAVKA